MYVSVGKLAILNQPVATSQAFFNMLFNNDDLRDYIYHYLTRVYEFKGWEMLISTGTQDNLNAEKVKAYKINLPTNNKELKDISSFFKKNTPTNHNTARNS